ncbi:hypothetical protein [Helicobacter burdigaliensis]|uniref:hypothetical protein n=1 Tax=Helicobacter burdigaliensis TaxID=2315334 RepID=UPI000EF743C3|nr:hypothetical protein [Helicobacter burdigaliensis]
MLPEKKKFKVIDLIKEFEFFKEKHLEPNDFRKLGFNEELIKLVISELQSTKGSIPNVGVIACPSYIREKFDEMDQEYYGRIINIFKNFSSLLENRMVLIYVDNLLNLGHSYEDLSEKDQRLLFSLFAAHDLYNSMRDLLIAKGSITRIVKRLCHALEDFYPVFKKQFERFHRY